MPTAAAVRRPPSELRIPHWRLVATSKRRSAGCCANGAVSASPAPGAGLWVPFDGYRVQVLPGPSGPRGGRSCRCHGPGDFSMLPTLGFFSVWNPKFGSPLGCLKLLNPLGFGSVS